MDGVRGYSCLHRTEREDDAVMRMRGRRRRKTAAPGWAAVCAILFACCLITGCAGESAPGVAAPDHLAGAGRIGAVSAASGWPGGFIAVSDRRPAEAAERVLARGGNAIDAAAIVLFMLNVVEPQSSGIGGGGFMMVHLADRNQTLMVDSRETAPAAADAEMFLDSNGRPMPYALASTSGISVGVPGALRGVELALARWGTLSLAQALAPATAAAEGGIIVDRRLADSIRHARLQTQCGSAPWDEARLVFRPGNDPSGCGRPPRVGDLLVQPQLAQTLRLIAARGTAAFYDCNDPSGLAQALVATQRAARRELGERGAGRMSCADLAAYRAVVREPLEVAYRNWLIRVPPPPSSGGIALIQMLRMLERFPLGDTEAAFGREDFATLNVMQEAMRLSFSDRAVWMGDTDVLPELPTRGLIDPRYLAQRSTTCPGDPGAAAYCITPGMRAAGIRAGDPRGWAESSVQAPRQGAAATRSQPGRPEGGETTHFTIVDRRGNVVSWTNTVEAPWGTGLMVPGFGFLLNNELTDFNLVPQRHGNPGDADWNPGADDAAPRKRPRSSMTPVIVFAPAEGGHAPRPVAAYGSPGGSTIINTVLGVTLDLIDFRLSVREAVEAPRLSLTSAGEQATTAIESGFDAVVLQRLRSIGYDIADTQESIGAVQAVVIDRQTGLADGFADPRRDGRGIGVPAR